MSTPFASLQQLDSRRAEHRYHRHHSLPPQLAPPYAYQQQYHPTPQSYNSFNSYAIPASSGSSQSWQLEPPAPYQRPQFPGPPQYQHLFQPLPMPIPPRYSERYPPPHHHLGEGHAPPVPYYTYLHPSASQGWSDPGLREFAAGLDQRAVPITRDRPSEYDLTRRVWDTYQPQLSQEPFGQDASKEAFLPYGEFSHKSVGTWKTPSSPEQRRTRSHSHSRPHSKQLYPYQFYAYPVTAMPIPTHHPAYNASQPMHMEKQPSPPRPQPHIVPPPVPERFIIPPSDSDSSTSSSPPRRRKCFLARLFSGSGKKPGMAALPDVQRRDVFFESGSPQSDSSASSTMANYGSREDIAEMGRKEVKWGK